MKAALVALALLAAPAGAADWIVQSDGPATVRERGGVLDIDAPKGVTLWHRRALSGRVAIDYDVMAVSEGGPNDQVSDVNAFWMAANALARPRNGKFEDYDDLRTYYVGIGGNRNTTTRMRRYVGRAGHRPLLSQHDRKDSLLVPNVWTHIRLIADGNRIAVERDGKPLFEMIDPTPYTRGHFALRTTQSHLRVRNVKFTRLR